MAAKVINVSNAVQLKAAIKAVKGGETILLAPGNYGYVEVKGRALADTVTIKSADSSRDAVFSDVRVHKSAGFAFVDVDVSRPLRAGERDFTQAVYVSDSKRIDFVGVDFSGSMDNNPWNDGVGLRIAYSSDVRLVDSTFEQWTNAATFENTSSVVVAGNTVAGVREGFDFATVSNVTIAQNQFSGFKPNWAAGDHSDAIQFWATAKGGSSHVVIRDNSILVGANGGTQGVLVGSNIAGVRHSDFVLENNLYNGEARHGFTLNAVDGGAIRGNTVTSAAGARLEAGINVSDTTNLVVADNIAPMLMASGTNPGLVMRDNVDLWDPKSRIGIALDQIFSGSALGSDALAYRIKPGSIAARLDAGFESHGGIGAAGFDLAQSSRYHSIESLLMPLAHIA